MPADRDSLDRVVQAKTRVERPVRKKRKRMPKSTEDPGLVAYLAERRKAIAGLLTPVVVYAGARAGLGLSDEVSISVAGLLAGALVLILPNSYGKG